MSRFKLLSLALCLALLYAGCKEEPPFINYDPPKVTFDTSYIDPAPATADMKRVLLEDFSGVQCKNCPDAQKIAHDMDSTFPGRMSIVTIHPLINALNTLVRPINDPPNHVSKQDFRTVAGATICEQVVGVPNSLPKGGVDRMLFSDKTDILIDRTDWASKINGQFSVASPVNISIVPNAGASATEVEFDITLRFTAAVTDSNYLSIMLVEDSIIDAQEYETIVNGIPQVEVIDNYVHMHVLRDMFTNYTGDLRNKNNSTTLVPGRVFKKRYKLQLTNAKMQRKNLKILAFVHRNGGNGKRAVLQSAEEHVQ